MKVLIEEKEKQDKSIINQLSKTIADNSKVLDDFGMTPSVLSRMKNAISRIILILKGIMMSKRLMH